MSDSKGMSGPQFRADRPEEQEAVRTTIVGGRPPGSGQQLGAIPRGVEVLVKKASVDEEFREVLLAERAGAAERIGLTLDPAEALMLAAVPSEQLETIIVRTNVPTEHRRAFLGTAAAAMLAALGVMNPGCGRKGQVKGERPDLPTVDENGRPKRNATAGEGGAAPYEPPPKAETSSEPSAPPKSGGEESPDEPPQSPDVRPTSRGIRPDIPARGGIRPDPKPQ